MAIGWRRVLQVYVSEHTLGSVSGQKAENQTLQSSRRDGPAILQPTLVLPFNTQKALRLMEGCGLPGALWSLAWPRLCLLACFLSQPINSCFILKATLGTSYT